MNYLLFVIGSGLGMQLCNKISHSVLQFIGSTCLHTWNCLISVHGQPQLATASTILNSIPGTIILNNYLYEQNFFKNMKHFTT